MFSTGWNNFLLFPVENTVGKGEIACYEQFLLFPQCFQKAYFPRVLKGVIVWEWVKPPCQSMVSLFLANILLCFSLFSLFAGCTEQQCAKEKQWICQ